MDDDNYVNIPALDELLKMYNPIGDWYLGRTSTPKPLIIRTKSQVSLNVCNNSISNVGKLFSHNFKNKNFMCLKIFNVTDYFVCITNNVFKAL